MMPATNSLPRYHRAATVRERARGLGLLFFLAASLVAATSLTEQGISAFAQGRYIEAARLLQTAVTQNPSDEHAREFLALAKAAGGRCQDADRRTHHPIPEIGRPRTQPPRRPRAGAVPECRRLDRQSAGRRHAARSEVSERRRRPLPGRAAPHESVQRRDPAHVREYARLVPRQPALRRDLRNPEPLRRSRRRVSQSHRQESANGQPAFPPGPRHPAGVARSASPDRTPAKSSKRNLL